MTIPGSDHRGLITTWAVAGADGEHRLRPTPRGRSRFRDLYVSPVSDGGSDASGGRGMAVRYPAIDVLRGIALMSMVTSHFDDFHEATFSARVLHSARWFDGAFSFVALSGVVTGLVHRRVVERRGVRASAHKLLRRSAWPMLVRVCALRRHRRRRQLGRLGARALDTAPGTSTAASGRRSAASPPCAWSRTTT